jgi:hypothetical protein
MFEKSFLTNLAFIFTRWPRSKKDIKNREKKEKTSEEIRIKGIN